MVTNLGYGEPELIQGGMGVGISNWKLAQAVAQAGERLDKQVLGVVSGVGLAITIVFRLRSGDENTKNALEAFPVPQIGQEILDMYWKKSGSSGRFKMPPKPEILVNGSLEKKAALERLIVAANFAEVWLAKQGHSGPIGINYLEKVQLPRLPEMFGAILGGVDYVLMGAGIPLQVPGALDALATWNEAEYKIDIIGGERFNMTFDPKTIVPKQYRKILQRPKFLAIVSHHALAQALATRSNGDVNGFVVEGPSAGGHNAPARGKEINEMGEPIYGVRDKPDLAKIAALGKPFWLAGGFATPEKIADAKESGAVGVQIGSAFALSNESGMREDVKKEVRKRCYAGEIVVISSAIASPSGYPFQVVDLDLENSLSKKGTYQSRKRSCSLGYLVEGYSKEGGGIGFRCPAEPIKTFVAKGGQEDQTDRRVCLCNGLASTAKDGQRPESPDEPFIVTLGKDQSFVSSLLKCHDGSYSTEDVIRTLLV